MRQRPALPCVQGVIEKLCFFLQFTATHPLYVGEQLILARDLSVHSLSYWLAVFCASEGEVEKNKKKILGENTVFSKQSVPFSVCLAVFLLMITSVIFLKVGKLNSHTLIGALVIQYD